MDPRRRRHSTGLAGGRPAEGHVPSAEGYRGHLRYADDRVRREGVRGRGVPDRVASRHAECGHLGGPRGSRRLWECRFSTGGTRRRRPFWTMHRTAGFVSEPQKSPTRTGLASGGNGTMYSFSLRSLMYARTSRSCTRAVKTVGFGKESVWRTRRLARANQSRTVREHDEPQGGRRRDGPTPRDRPRDRMVPARGEAGAARPRA